MVDLMWLNFFLALIFGLASGLDLGMRTGVTILGLKRPVNKIFIYKFKN